MDEFNRGPAEKQAVYARGAGKEKEGHLKRPTQCYWSLNCLRCLWRSHSSSRSLAMSVMSAVATARLPVRGETRRDEHVATAPRPRMLPGEVPQRVSQRPTESLCCNPRQSSRRWMGCLQKRLRLLKHRHLPSRLLPLR